MNFRINDDGTELDAILEMPENAEGPVPLAIIIHGFTGNKDERHLLAVAEMMRETGMATLRVDMYGHGKSDGTFLNHTLFKWFTNAMTVIDYVRLTPEFSTKFSRIYLCGHSQGGLTTVMVGAMKRDVLCGLIPMSPALMIPEGSRNGNILGMPVDPEHIPDVFTSPDGWTLGSNYARVAQTIYPEEAIRAYKGEVLVVQGEADATVSCEYVKKAVEGYENCTFVPVADETHCYDNHLDKVVEEIRAYILEHGWNK